VVKPRLKVWVVLDERVKLGDGRARLLTEIDKRGSIKEAVARMGMSYRNAWGYLQELERAAGFKLLERRRGPGGSGGARLTPKGRVFLARYWRFRQGLDDVVERHFRRSFRDP
jgi:molybdate transport repressor ModE-like protein